MNATTFSRIENPQAVFLVMCDPSMSCEQPRPIELYAQTGLGCSQLIHSSFIGGSHTTENTASDQGSSFSVSVCPWACTIKHFKAVINIVCQHVFKYRQYPSLSNICGNGLDLTRLHSKGCLLALLSMMKTTGTKNTLAFHASVFIAII